MTFKDLGIIEPILKALGQEGYTNPTPIQEQSIPILLNGKDLLGVAQTGTGKTAAFAVPIIQQIYNNQPEQGRNRKIKALVVTPTRELAIQIGESFTAYGKFTGIKNTVIFGGVKQGKQVQALRNGIDVLIATPGRLLDLMNQGFISLRDIEYVVLDEADHMLDMGFIHDIKKIIAKLPSKRQSLFFSATMPKDIVELSRKILGDFERVTVKPEQATAEKVEQVVYFVSKGDKVNLLVHLLEEQPNSSVLVFSRTKHGANKIVKKLAQAEIRSAAIHGNKSQTARQNALNDFKDGKLGVLIATDIAARGIDVDGLSLVINFDLPNVPETYVHRIGRTGRANASGIAVSFCDREERPYLRDIEKLINLKVPKITEHPFHEEVAEGSPIKKSRNTQRPKNPSQNRNRNQSRNSNYKGKSSGNRNNNDRNKSRGRD
ncbi:DEAD/DEAH box helicase [Maribacter polysiphoniae]|uniref:DEAD-box ATP-dependent RNA helicase RhpA n=2 Tax=Maribacter polysiphoniae TaxID=429344 RepID=A0A316E4N5_9FLAO|nr:DEAD/DEAH box helicase [Maribacter polysiphoniae]MBD1261096.1 DEAD/DEAH box helicase [Maribacter polysiphoniae]PWK23663.1 ATP-dependent RNA helicase RhlE [Maribacter polysiphoniae]